MQRALAVGCGARRAACCVLRGLAGTVTGGALGDAAAAASVLILDWPRQAPMMLWLLPVAAWTSEEGRAVPIPVRRRVGCRKGEKQTVSAVEKGLSGCPLCLFAWLLGLARCLLVSSGGFRLGFAG